MPLRSGIRRTPLGALVVAALAIVLPVASGPLAAEAPIKAAPRPVDGAGRALYTFAHLPGLPAGAYAELSDLGFILELDDHGLVYAWLSSEEITKLGGLGIPWIELEDPARPSSRAGTDAEHLDYPALTTFLQQVAGDHPEITRLVSIGQSVQGRELWMLKITDNPDVEEDEPGFRYISSLHGDEVVGIEMMVRLIDLLTSGYGTDPRATRIVEGIELWVMPLANPDGRAVPQRFNAGGVDLNRNFPDRWDSPQDTTEGRAAETSAIMDWQALHTTTLSANFHGGALVANYPYDNNEQGASVYTASPDDDIFIDLSLEYSEDNLPMYNGAFSQGITNGADWYVLSGGLQDWSYDYRGDMDLTLEISNQKFPAASTLDGFWDDNRESILSYLERVLTGVRGVVTDAETGLPLGARLEIQGRSVPFYSDPGAGDFHRPLPAGGFTLLASAPGYEAREIPFTIADAEADATRVDVQLAARPQELVHQDDRIVDDSGGDGFLDAGETGTIAVTLRNEGASAGGVSGTLLRLSPYAEGGGSAAWPDIAAGQEAESVPPHFSIAAAAGTPPGHKLAFAIDWSTAEGRSGTTGAFFVPVGAPSLVNEPSVDTPQAILDNTTTTSSLDVLEDLEIDEINVAVQIDHTYRGDLRVTLVAPDGSEILLHDRSGGSADDLRTTYDTYTEAVESLATLSGRSTLGAWTLRVEDLGNGDQGTLESWTLQRVSRPWESPISEVLLRAVEREAGSDVRLEWWPVGSASSYRVYRSGDPGSESAFVDVSAEDDDTSDTSFVDRGTGALTCWIVSAEGYSGEGLWGHFGR